ncbi:glutamate 5-kinase [Oleiphilus sp. HI0081]|uniref:glutamate 5-kinase n=4 Tax=Oleiphilus TaxID=141450 RepID=UPI0007C226FB|nr:MULTISPECIES: glutamate 5-kinase [unclassified Oleiphilus]KZY48794.1 glutamate 5-kinase [Oleiphilus sp. HI0050]KZZ21593.1 glutamate 5-kinase [Oleiphilus sp. HI0081]KZY39900.1 glutamate 5-kinase [Oleiphilus sp. HI0043]KZZ31162.1 glutamate 5-kinase [Oleiphilus sp. HI0086]KZZ72455.1 glutamate 5-kinase [Oleiphilus sp. HI0128]
MTECTGRAELSRANRWVVKIGSALLTDDGKGLARESIGDWVAQLSKLHRQGLEIILVSSGSVAEGMARLGMSERPQELHLLQAAAAVGQMGLVQAYEEEFQKHGLHTAQVLLTHDDLSNRKRYLNARSTVRSIVELGAIPIINENDTVVTDEIRFGDNDTLGALVANLVEADGLIILTDQAGMFDKDPRRNADAQMLTQVLASDERLEEMASGGAGALGRGGMATKVRAARLAARSGAYSVIVGGKIESVLLRLRAAEDLGTMMLPSTSRQVARKQWLAGHLQTAGNLVLDDGAVAVLERGGKSLLSVGVVSASGRFKRGDMVSCKDSSGREFARGLVNYDAPDAKRILGKSSDEILSILGFCHEAELIHRDNLVLL